MALVSNLLILASFGLLGLLLVVAIPPKESPHCTSKDDHCWTDASCCSKICLPEAENPFEASLNKCQCSEDIERCNVDSDCCYLNATTKEHHLFRRECKEVTTLNYGGLKKEKQCVPGNKPMKNNQA